MRRAESLGAARLLYDARLFQGLLSLSGTLAVRVSPDSIDATLTGPFGAPLARYEDGALRGDGIRTLAIAPEQLRWLLAGVWEGETPTVVGLDGRDALLRWNGGEQVEGVIDLGESRFLSVRVARTGGAILATYSGALDPWPRRLEVQDLRSGSKLRLTLVAQETAASARHRVARLRGPSPSESETLTAGATPHRSGDSRWHLLPPR